MIGVSEQERRIITDILAKRLKEGEVWVFGSRYKGTHRDYSDLDLAIVGEGQLSASVLDGIKDDFSESELVFRVDILDYNGISDHFQRIIDHGYEVIYQTEHGTQSVNE